MTKTLPSCTDLQHVTVRLHPRLIAQVDAIVTYKNSHTKHHYLRTNRSQELRMLLHLGIEDYHNANPNLKLPDRKRAATRKRALKKRWDDLKHRARQPTK